MVVERAFATSSYATVCTHIGLPPSRIAIATSSPSGSVVSGSTTTFAPSSRASPAITDASGTSPSVFHESTVTEPDVAAAAGSPPKPRTASTPKFPAAKSASTTAIAIAKRRIGRAAKGDDVCCHPLVLQPERLRPDQHERHNGGAEHDGPAEDAGEHSTNPRRARRPRPGAVLPIGWESAVRRPRLALGDASSPRRRRRSRPAHAFDGLRWHRTAC